MIPSRKVTDLAREKGEMEPFRVDVPDELLNDLTRQSKKAKKLGRTREARGVTANLPPLERFNDADTCIARGASAIAQLTHGLV